MMRNPNAFLFLSECILVIISLAVLTSPLTPSNLSAAPDFPSASKRPFVLDIHQFGAKGDGLSDDTQVLGEVWKLACSSARQSTILLPAGNKYLVGPVDFAGPCRNKVTILICGTLVAPDNPDIWKGFNRRRWLYFYGIKHLTVEGGGIINGMGAQWWAQSCKRNSTKRCRPAPTVHFSPIVNVAHSRDPAYFTCFRHSLNFAHSFFLYSIPYICPLERLPQAITFHKCNNLKISNLQMVDSQQMHMAFTSCFHVKATHLNVVAPDTSPNTDGIHISSSSGIEIRKSLIKTGDDCISMVGNSSRIRIRDVICGPGHGISVGSLGKSNSSDQIHDVLVEAIFLLHTQNGLRIKTWQGGSGFASKITFKNVRMENVSHPIIVDQYYCDSSLPCLNQTRAVKVGNISFIDIRGTSASEEAVRFACSDTFSCEYIYMEDVHLVSQATEDTRSFCWNAYGSISGLIYPPPCLACNDGVIMQNVASTAIETM